MNYKLNIGNYELKVPAGEDNPEIAMEMKDMSIEIEGLKISEVAGMIREFKDIVCEITELQVNLGIKKEDHDFKREKQQQDMYSRCLLLERSKDRKHSQTEYEKNEEPSF